MKKREKKSETKARVISEENRILFNDRKSFHTPFFLAQEKRVPKSVSRKNIRYHMFTYG